MKYGNLALLGMLMLFMAAPSFAVDTAAETSDLSPVVVRGEVPALDAEVDMDAWNEATMSSSYSQFDMNRRLAMGLDQDPDDGDVETVTAGDDDGMMMEENKLNPGRALLLSAIMPGAGELYAGKTWRAAGFFALEMAGWVGAIYYAQQGEDKETEYEKYGDKWYHENVYRQVEYNAALDPTVGNSGAFEGEQSEWENNDWQEKLGYLPGNFTHDLPTERTQQYYENIGKYMTQFGYGWDDFYQSIGGTAQDAVAYAGTVGYQWDGSSPLANVYIDMRDESNKLLDRSATFFAVIMVNHVASAMHAGFTVRAMNKSAEVEPELGSIWHNDRQVTTAGLRIRF
jgi:Family of unknown function (DUF5683)